MFSGSSSEGKVYAITESAGKREVKTLAVGYTSPIGVAFKDGALYVWAVNRILRFDDIENKLNEPGKPGVVTDIYPSEKHHGGKFIAFDPDGLLYVAVGAPCNICEPPEPFASITRIKPDGTDFEIYAQGIRNTVGFDWHPETKELWFTDNGRDWMGDNQPPMSLTGRHAKACILATLIAMAAIFPTPNSAQNAIAAGLHHLKPNSSLMWPL